MAKRKVSKAARTIRVSSSQKMSPVIQFGVIFIIVAALVLAYYVGTMR